MALQQQLLLAARSARLVPPAHHLDAWRKDYQEMRGEKFFGEVPAFDEIIRVVGDFEKRFNQLPPALRIQN